MINRYRQKTAGVFMIVLMGAAAVLGGCKTGEGAGPEAVVMPEGTASYDVDGTYTLPILEEEWNVEIDDYGDLLFMNKEDKNVAFSASKWENMTISSEKEYKEYYEKYLDGIQENHPEAEAVSFDIPQAGGVSSLYMGVKLMLAGESYRVLMYLIPAPGGNDTLSFTMTVPETGADAAEEKFRGIIEGIHFEENETQQISN